MGIKARVVVGIGGLVLTGIAAVLGLKKKEEQRYGKVQGIIANVDKKKPEKEEQPKSVEEMSSEVNEAIKDMDIVDDDVTKIADTMATIVQKIATENNMTVDELLKYGENELDKVRGLTMDELWKKQEEFDKQKEKAEEEWKQEVEKAVENKNFSKLEDLFDQKYAGGPWHPSPASVFMAARNDGYITDDLMEKARKYYDRLWNYSGD